MTYAQWLSQATALLCASDSPKRDAEILLAFVVKKSRAFIFAFAETTLTKDQQQQLNILIKRREVGEPIAYLVGEREFWSLMLTVSPATLIPRPDTECLVELALERLPVTSSSILDLGTGTGAIALAIASERPDCHLTAIDIQTEAIKLAQENAKKLAINNVLFERSDWYQSLTEQRFQMIVSNPPYIARQDFHLKKGDLRFEPKSALISEKEGLADIEHIVQKSVEYLQMGGWLLIEHGWQQASKVRTFFLQHGYHYVETFNDYAGHERITLGSKCNN